MAIESKLSRGPIGRPMGQGDEEKSGVPWLLIVIVAVIILAAGLWWYTKGRGLGASSMSEAIATGEYQAVFLDNGQVYFGKLTQSESDFFILIDIFYMQSGPVGLDQTTNLQLTKLGSEAHGPEDKMQINKEHILFIEEMKAESKVVKAIEEYRSKKQ